MNSVNAYYTLDEGISETNGDFILSQSEYQNFLEGIELGLESDVQIVTYDDDRTNLQHSLLFNMTAATSFSNFTNGTYNTNNTGNAYFGSDFAASTISMVTDCFPSTQACNIHNSSEAETSDLSIPFNCSSLFSGDIWQAPTDGLEQFKGWHTAFFDNTTGAVSKTKVQSQLNPFYFNVTAALTSADLTVLEGVNDPQVSSGAVVDAGNGRVALALTCKSTVYNVHYSLVDGYFSFFNATIADPRMASIIKAPLQLGFGRYSLYQKAQLGLLLNANITVANQMSLSFSQIGMALASGAFKTTYSSKQRERYYATVTEVPGYILWFMILVCLLYVAFGIGITVAAFMLRRDPVCAENQAQLVPTTQLPILETIKQMAIVGYKKGKELEKGMR
jgi:hypothetical protein